MAINVFFLLYILEKYDINKACRSSFEKMFLFVKIFYPPQRKLVIKNKRTFGGTQGKDYSS